MNTIKEPVDKNFFMECCKNTEGLCLEKDKELAYEIVSLLRKYGLNIYDANSILDSCKEVLMFRLI